ncbi:hypothetical protein Pint_25843 [Pistacia integerrima]|uniref:Uncharacterized protein n=1 Tax=Pistacia integerrima TaxID=434235 RepID=A0ACC0YFI0_9ROSI|nr:hypothetical protein Pint_25843 [Pistacia integerrima]
MEAISIGSNPNFYFQVGKLKISEGMKCLKDLVEWYKDNFTPESAGREIESLAQLGEVPVSSDVNGTDMQRGQEISPTREQNAYVGPTPNQENTSSAKKRKLKSKVWEDFTKYKKDDGEERAECKHCNKDFVGSSKSGTTHLHNHLKSCRGLRNPVGVVNREKEKSLIDPESNGSDWVLKVIKYGPNGIRDDIFNIYEQETDKLRGYLHKLSCRFNVTIEKIEYLWFLIIWFIDDSWELKMVYFLLEGREEVEETELQEIELEEDQIHVIELEEDQIHVIERVKFCLEDWNIDKKVCSVVGDSVFIAECGKVIEDINSWLNERGSFPVIQSFLLIIFSLSRTGKKVGESYMSDKAFKIWDYCRTSSNVNKFQDVAEKALFKGKTVTSLSVPSCWLFDGNMLEWVLGCKEAFSELNDIDPDFKSINFIEKEWNEATLIYYIGWKVFDDLYRDFEPTNKTANGYFPIFSDIMLKLVQLGESDDHNVSSFASKWREELEEYWNNSNLILVITVILDPRFKMDIVKQFYEKIYGNDANEYLKKIIDDVTNIYNKYAGSTDNNIVTSESELDRYLKDSKCPPGEAFNILDWWRVESRTYPTLAKIARDVLPIPVAVLGHSSLLRGVKNAINANIEADLQVALACTNVWLNFPVIK